MQRRQLLSCLTIFALLFGQFASVLHAVSHFNGKHAETHAQSPLHFEHAGYANVAVTADAADSAGHRCAASAHVTEHNPGHVHTHSLHSIASHGPRHSLFDIKTEPLTDSGGQMLQKRLATHHEEPAAANCLAFHLHGAGQAVLPEFPLVGCCFIAGEYSASYYAAIPAYDSIRSFYIRGPPL